MPRQRLIVATLLFLGAFAVIAQLAWNTAIATSGPWFSPAISRDVYSTTMIAATVLVAVLAALASGQSASAAREARALDLRFNILRGSGVMASGSGGIDIDADIESSIVIGEAIIETRHKIVNSLIGRYATIRSADGRLPKGQQLIIGENSALFL